MIQKRLVNMGDQADVGSCVPQALAGRQVRGPARHQRLGRNPVASARALGPGCAPGTVARKQPMIATWGR